MDYFVLTITPFWIMPSIRQMKTSEIREALSLGQDEQEDFKPLGQNADLLTPNPELFPVCTGSFSFECILSPNSLLVQTSSDPTQAEGVRASLFFRDDSPEVRR